MDAKGAAIKGLKWSGLLLVAFFIACLWYAGAAWISGLFPLGGKSAAVPPARPAAYLCEAAFHTDIALPLDGEIINWRREFRGLLPDYLPRDTFILFGWGDSVFFTEVLHPDDLTLGRGLSALAGMNPVAMRIVPVYGSDVREVCDPLPGGQDTKAALIHEIQRSLRRDGEGNYIQLETPVFGELLLVAHGRYSPFTTCNQWTANALGKAGLPRAVFAPFTWNVTAPLRRLSAPPGSEDINNTD